MENLKYIEGFNLINNQLETLDFLIDLSKYENLH